MAPPIGKTDRPLTTPKLERATRPIALPDEVAARVNAGELEVVEVKRNDNLWAMWSMSKTEQPWPEFLALNKHLTEAEGRNSGNLVFAADKVLFLAKKKPEAPPKPVWAPGATAAAAAPVPAAPVAAAPVAAAPVPAPPVPAAAVPPAATAPDAATAHGLASLKAAGYDGAVTPQALAAELAKRVLDPVSVDNAFLNAALEYAHATKGTAALNAELAKLVDPRATRRGPQSSAQDVYRDAQKAGPTGDNYLRGLLNLQNSDSAKKRSEDFLTTGADQHRGTTGELVAEGALGVLKSIAEHPVKAALTAAGVTAAVVALPIAASAAALALGASAAAAATAGAATGVALAGGFALDGAIKIGSGAKAIVDAEHLTGAERDEKLLSAGGNLAAGVPSLLGGAGSTVIGLKAAKSVLGRSAAQGPELAQIPNANAGGTTQALPAPAPAPAPALPPVAPAPPPAPGPALLGSSKVAPAAGDATTGTTASPGAGVNAQNLTQAQAQAKAAAFARPPAMPPNPVPPAPPPAPAPAPVPAPAPAAVAAPSPEVAPPQAAPAPKATRSSTRRGGNVSELERAAAAAAKPLEHPNLAQWNQTLESDLLPVVKVTGAGDELAPRGSLASIVEITGHDAVLLGSNGSTKVPLASLSPATAAERGIRRGADLTLLGPGPGAGKTANVVDIQGQNLVVEVPNAAMPDGSVGPQSLVVPLDAAAAVREAAHVATWRQRVDVGLEPTAVVSAPNQALPLGTVVRIGDLASGGDAVVVGPSGGNVYVPLKALSPAGAAERGISVGGDVTISGKFTAAAGQTGKVTAVRGQQATVEIAAPNAPGGKITQQVALDFIEPIKVGPSPFSTRWASALERGVVPEARVSGPGTAMAPQGSLVTIAEIRGDVAIVAGREGSGTVPLSSLTPATAAERGIRMGSDVAIRGKTEAAGLTGRVVALSDTEATVRVPDATVAGGAREVRVPLDLAAATREAAQVGRWRETLQNGATPSALLTESVQGLPSGALVRITSISGRDATVTGPSGSVNVPLASLRTASAADRGLSVGSDVTITGTGQGGGLCGKVTGFDGQNLILEIPSPTSANPSAVRTMHVPFDFAQRITAGPNQFTNMWAEGLKRGLVPVARVSGEGTSLAPPGSLLQIVDIQGDYAVVAAQRGSGTIPLSSLAPASAAERGLRVGVEVTVRGDSVVAGQQGSVLRLNGNMVTVRAVDANGSVTEVLMPLDFVTVRRR